MVRFLHIVIAIGALGIIVFGGRSAAAEPAAQTRLVILPVNHSQQLVARNDNAGFLTDMIERLKPDALCIENYPDAYLRGSAYDFLYEQTSIAVPLARELGIEIDPIDWEPGRDEHMLAFGEDLDQTPLIRPKVGWGAFLTFPDAKDLWADFLNPQPDVVEHVQRWAKADPPQPSLDAPRRLYLFRTLLQARRIAAVAHAHPGKTVMVVVGEFHKWDIERLLADDPTISIQQPAKVFEPNLEEAERLLTPAQRVAVLSFNLLGLQASTHNVDWDWIRTELRALPTSEPDAERAIFETRLEQLTGRVNAVQALQRYRALIVATPADVMFTWTGNTDRSRTDSYFDPFGNLSVKRRLWLEVARAQSILGNERSAHKSLEQASAGLSEQKVFQLRTYAERFLLEKPRHHRD